MPQEEEGLDPAPEWAALPAAVLAGCCFAHLSAADLAAARAACRAWAAAGASPALWRRHLDARYRYPSRVCPATPAVYAARRRTDAAASAAVADMLWPDRLPGAMRQLRHLGFPNVKDELLRLLNDPDAGCRQKFWARQAAQDCAAAWASERLRRAAPVAGGAPTLEGVASTIEEFVRPLDHIDPAAAEDVLERAAGEVRRRVDEAAAAAGGAQPDGPAKLAMLTAAVFGDPPAGLGLSGNRRDFYDVSNSCLSLVLGRRGCGIPITLGLVLAAVARRAGVGLRAELLGLPGHVLVGVRWEDEGGRAHERFVDAFDHRAAAMAAAEVGEWAAAHGFHGDPWRAAMSAQDVCLRMLNNVDAAVERQRGRRPELRKAVLDVLDAFRTHLAQPATVQLDAALVHAAVELERFAEARELLEKKIRHGPLGRPPNENVRLQLQRMVATPPRHFPPRPGRSPAGLAVGSVVRHRRHGYVGVVVGWDDTCRAGQDWQQQMGVANLARGAAQPFYHVLAMRQAGQEAYVAEENLEPTAVPPGERQPARELHPFVGRYFERLSPSGDAYELNAWFRSAGWAP